MSAIWFEGSGFPLHCARIWRDPLAVVEFVQQSAVHLFIPLIADARKIDFL
jgi:hypothetical protein